MDDIIIETSRLILREFKYDDWEDIHSRYSTDEDVIRYMPWGPNTEDDTKAFVERMLKEQEKDPRKLYPFTVIEKESGNLLGAVEISIGAHQNGGLGYCYCKDAWGRGIGTEVAAALIEFGFKKLDLHRIYADCDAENFGSQRVIEKNMMHREGFFKSNTFIKGHWRDNYHYAILREEWETARK